VPGFSKPKTCDLFNPVQPLPLVAALSQLFQYPAAGLILRGQFNFYFVARQQANEIPFLHSRRVRENLPAFAKVDPKYQLRQLFQNRSLTPAFHGLVKTQGPFEVTATQCSK
jgi:hypothetical protein